MGRRRYRFFGPFLDTQERWLNSQAQGGWRLVDTGKLRYDFEPCRAGEYQYRMEFVAHRPHETAEDYRAFLEDLGYRVFYKNINLNFSVGKVRYRPWAEPGARLATKATTFDRELLIVEKGEDGTPFELYTTDTDKAKYYTANRNAWLTTASLFLAAALALGLRTGALWGSAVFALLGAVALVPTVRCHRWVRRYKSRAEIQE